MRNERAVAEPMVADGSMTGVRVRDHRSCGRDGRPLGVFTPGAEPLDGGSPGGARVADLLMDSPTITARTPRRAIVEARSWTAESPRWAWSESAERYDVGGRATEVSASVYSTGSLWEAAVGSPATPLWAQASQGRYRTVRWPARAQWRPVGRRTELTRTPAVEGFTVRSRSSIDGCTQVGSHAVGRRRVTRVVSAAGCCRVLNRQPQTAPGGADRHRAASTTLCAARRADAPMATPSGRSGRRRPGLRWHSVPPRHTPLVSPERRRSVRWSPSPEPTSPTRWSTLPRPSAIAECAPADSYMVVRGRLGRNLTDAVAPTRVVRCAGTVLRTRGMAFSTPGVRSVIVSPWPGSAGWRTAGGLRPSAVRCPSADWRSQAPCRTVAE